MSVEAFCGAWRALPLLCCHGGVLPFFLRCLPVHRNRAPAAEGMAHMETGIVDGEAAQVPVRFAVCLGVRAVIMDEERPAPSGRTSIDEAAIIPWLPLGPATGQSRGPHRYATTKVEG